MVRLLLLGAPQFAGSLPVQPGRITQPRPLALLALLAAAGRHGVTRDRAVALLWGESSEAHARHHLSDALYIVHRELGADAVDGSNRILVLNETVVPTDLAAFSRAVQSRDYQAALGEYRGPFLDGFHLVGARAFEEWVGAERQNLRRQYGGCLEALAAAAEAAGDLKGAADWWRQLLGQDPYNSRVAISLGRTLLASGDRGNALEALEAHRQLLRCELDADTGYEVRSLLEDVRNGSANGGTATPAPSAGKGAGDGSTSPPAGVPGTSDLRRPTIRRWAPLAWVSVPAMAGAGLAWFLMARQPTTPVDPDLVAVPPFHAMGTSPAIQRLAADVPDMFWATITGEFGLRVSDPSALEQRWQQLGGEVGEALALSEALELAQTAGAGLLVLGSVAGTDMHVRLTASLMTVPGGNIRVAPTTVEGPYGEFPGLVDRLVALLLAQDGGVPPHRLPDLAAHDPAAVQAYLSGLRARRRVVWESEWFHRALELDSGLVLAALERYRLGEADQAMARFVWDRRAQLPSRDAALVIPLLGWRFGATTSYAQRIAQLEDVINNGPAWIESLNELSVSLFVLGRGAGIEDWASRARVAGERLLEYEPANLPALFRLFSLAVFENDSATARRYAMEYMAREIQASEGNALGWLFSWIMRLRLALLVGDSAEVATLWSHGDEVIRVAARHPMRTAPLYASELVPLVGGLLVDGRGLTELDTLLRAYRHVDPSPSFPLLDWARIRGRDAEWQNVRSAVYDAMPPVTAAGLRVRDALFLGEPEGAAEEAAAAFLDRVARGVLVPPDDSTDPTPRDVGMARARCWSTLWNVTHGDVRGARAVAHGLRDTPLAYRHAACAALIDALVTRAERGNLRAAVHRLDSVIRPFPMEIWPYERGVRDLTPGVDNLIVARLLAELGDTTRALAAIRRGPHGPVGNERTPHWSLGMLPEFLREEGRLAVATGDTVGAIRAYRHYLALRENVARDRGEYAEVQRELRALLPEGRPLAAGAARPDAR